MIPDCLCLSICSSPLQHFHPSLLRSWWVLLQVAVRQPRLGPAADVLLAPLCFCSPASGLVRSVSFSDTGTFLAREGLAGFLGKVIKPASCLFAQNLLFHVASCLYSTSSTSFQSVVLAVVLPYGLTELGFLPMWLGHLFFPHCEGLAEQSFPSCVLEIFVLFSSGSSPSLLGGDK